MDRLLRWCTSVWERGDVKASLSRDGLQGKDPQTVIGWLLSASEHKQQRALQGGLLLARASRGLWHEGGVTPSAALPSPQLPQVSKRAHAPSQDAGSSRPYPGWWPGLGLEASCRCWW